MCTNNVKEKGFPFKKILTIPFPGTYLRRMGRAISGDPGGNFIQLIFWYAPRQPMVAFRLDSLPTILSPPKSKILGAPLLATLVTTI